MLIVLAALALLYLVVRYFFPGIPYAQKDLSDLSEYQLRQMIRAFNTSYARLGFLCALLCAAFLSTSFWLHHFYVTEKYRADDLEKELEKQKEKADRDYNSLHGMYEWAINKKDELEEKVKDLQNQLYNAE